MALMKSLSRAKGGRHIHKLVKRVIMPARRKCLNLQNAMSALIDVGLLNEALLSIFFLLFQQKEWRQVHRYDNCKS